MWELALTIEQNVTDLFNYNIQTCMLRKPVRDKNRSRVKMLPGAEHSTQQVSKEKLEQES